MLILHIINDQWFIANYVIRDKIQKVHKYFLVNVIFVIFTGKNMFTNLI